MDDRHADDVERIRRSPVFDAAWYAAAHPEIAAEGIDPARHYLLHGAPGGDEPGPAFRTTAYAAYWPEVAGGEVNPLVHLSRMLEGTGITPDDRALIAGSVLFDADWYLRTYPDVAASGADPLDHYLAHGAGEGRDPGPRFSGAAYDARRPDVAAAGVNPLVHFLRRGIAEHAGSLTDLAPLPPPPQGRRAKSGPKAVFVAHELTVSGAPKLLQSLAGWFQRATDYDVHVVAMAGGPLLAAFEQFAPVHVVGRRAVAEAEVPALREAVRAFLGEEPAFTFVNSAAAGDYCRIDPFDAPTFGYVHELPQILAVFQDQFAALMRRARHVFCGARPVRDALIAAWPEAAARLSTRPSFIAPPDVDGPLSATDKAERRREVGWNPTRKLVVGCGFAHWRKQPLAFVRMAAELIRGRDREVDCAWIGDGPDLPEMRRMAAALGIADRLHLPGHRDDLRRLLAAADVFALPSVEDPMPLVCLEAGALSAPSVVFREATGFADLVEPEDGVAGGITVPLGEEAAFIDAVDRLLGDDTLRAGAAAALRARILSGYVEDRACLELLVAVRDKAGLPPRLSVLLPPAPAGAPLARRLRNIADQTFRDIELLMDGATQRRLGVEGPEVRIIEGDGAADGFGMWAPGIRAATGDILWLADPDDLAPPTFLERALAAFAPSGVRLAYGRSVAVGGGPVAPAPASSGVEQPTESFAAPARREVDRRLGRAPSIASPGSVLVRRAAAVEAIGAARGLATAGDWLFYVVAAHGGRIAYAHDAINYLGPRTSAAPPPARRLREIADVGAAIRQLYGPDSARDAAFHRYLAAEAGRLGHDGALPAGAPPEGLARRGPGLLYGVGDLTGGGAQMYAMRLLGAWAATPAPAVLFVAGHAPDHPGARARLDPLVPVVGPEDVAAEGGFPGLLRSYGIDAIVSGHWWADEAIGRYKAAGDVPQPWVIVMHGCYESVLAFSDQFPGYRETLKRAERHCDHWVWIAPKNRQVFDEGYVVPRRQSQIVTGHVPGRTFGLARRELGLPDDALVFALAGRALPAKGWQVALAALAQVRKAAAGKRDVRLLLVGDGPVADELRAAPLPDGVHIAPHTVRLDDHIAISDVALLPSWFEGETLPLVLIEFLAHGKPAIVSDIGLCGWAIGAAVGARAAGMVVPRDGAGGSVRPERLASAMTRFVADPRLAAAMAPHALHAAARFDIATMLEQFRALLDGLIVGPATVEARKIVRRTAGASSD